MNYPLFSGNHYTKFGNYQAYQANKPEINTSSLTVTLWPRKATSVASLVNHQVRVKSYWVDNNENKDPHFDLDLWLCNLNINCNLLSRSIHYTKFGNFPEKRSRNIEQTRFFQRPAVWPWPLKMWLDNQ